MKIEVERELYLAAPDGVAVYAQNPSYTRAAGTELVEAVKHECMAVDPVLGKSYYHARIFRRRSADHGRSWVDEPDLTTETSERLAGDHRCVPMHVLDPCRDVLICFYSTYEIAPDEPMFKAGNRRQRTYRMHYELSWDGGLSWPRAGQVIDQRSGYDAVRWGPGLEYGKVGGVADMLAYTWLDDDTLVFGLTVSNVGGQGDGKGPAAEGQWGVVYVQARWHDDASDLRFRCGDLITVGPGQASSGCCEPAVAQLDGGRLLNVMRCQGDQASGLHSTRYCTVSADGGRTWMQAEPLRYDDGSPVWTPASYSQFIRSAKTGKTYWLANILPGPVHGQTPRYPLVIAELDTQRGCIRKGSIQVIQDLPDGAPRERRYTNWGSYEERGSGDLILTMPEQPKLMDFSAMTRPNEFTADCLRYRLHLPATATSCR